MSTTSPAMLPQPPSVEALIKRRRPLRNVHKEALQTITPLDRLALWITVRVGSMAFFPVYSRMDDLAEVRAEHDLEVNVRAEREIEVILRRLEYQNTLPIAMVQKLGIESDVGHGIKTRFDATLQWRGSAIRLPLRELDYLTCLPASGRVCPDDRTRRPTILASQRATVADRAGKPVLLGHSEDVGAQRPCLLSERAVTCPARDGLSGNTLYGPVQPPKLCPEIWMEHNLCTKTACARRSPRVRRRRRGDPRQRPRP
jgi:hypothetical protein